MSVRAEKNIFYWDRGLLFGGKMQLKPSWMECNTPLVFEPNGKPTYAQPEGACRGFQLDRNIYFDTRTQAPMFFDVDWTKWRELGQDRNSRIVDPLFVNPNRYQFELRTDSPALALGIQSIDLSTVGPRQVAGGVTR